MITHSNSANQVGKISIQENQIVESDGGRVKQNDVGKRFYSSEEEEILILIKSTAGIGMRTTGIRLTGDNVKMDTNYT